MFLMRPQRMQRGDHYCRVLNTQIGVFKRKENFHGNRDNNSGAMQSLPQSKKFNMYSFVVIKIRIASWNIMKWVLPKLLTVLL